MRRHDDVISASEIGQWVYCQRAWFLARTGASNRNTRALTRGQRGHRRHSRQVAWARRLRLAALALIALGLLVATWGLLGLLVR